MAVSAYDQWLARREEQRRRICGDDRLSALPDDVIRLILRCLDTRSALATAAVSKHWARFRREHPVLEFKVTDILPERYHRRYERRSMRSMAISMNSFLDADEVVDHGQGRRRRRAHAMTLELFPGHNTAPFNRLVTKAIGDWGVEDLEIVVLHPTPCHGHDVSYSFPHHCFDDDDDLKSPTTGGGLKKLKLTNCTAHDPLAAAGGGGSSLPAFSSLTMLVLQDMPKWTRGRVYQCIVRACPSLQVLHLKSCVFWDLESMSIDAPASQITELVVDGCTFVSMTLRSLPRLERLALVGAPVAFAFGSLPRLNRLNLSFVQDPIPASSRHPMFPDMRDEYSVFSVIDPSDSFRDLECLVVRFTGPENWVVPIEGLSLGNVRRLLLADMPRSWDISWTCRLLEAAPYLETLHVHFVDDLHVGMAAVVDPAITRPPSDFKNRALKEVVIIGFKGTDGKHVRFVRLLIRNGCSTLENVTLLKHGRVREMGLWDWQVVATPEECQWSDEERDALLKEIHKGGNTSSTTRIILG
ncbi:uncharacterized protein LOC8057660 [Sorghum bicolor]|uniref:uncharacterized protein LOC8057660 n=1 Tax=Sorghum bicolor TaxID=4558 RepID=UPI000B425193|nr:uncharacterized protein LOC8057660 [Sorghum bicolor]|eukprot:XP_021309094.1 uncharacterized protein LOC8057660 [Sorghum bicolor]